MTRARILVVDASAAGREAVRRALQVFGLELEVDEAATRDDALARVQQRPYDVVLVGDGLAEVTDALDAARMTLPCVRVTKDALDGRFAGVVVDALLGLARARARGREELVAIVSHELRAPLHTLSLGLDALREHAGEAGRATAAKMTRSLDRMMRLLADLPEASLALDGPLTVEKSRVELRRLLRQVTDDVETAAGEAGVTVAVEPHAEPTHVVCDEPRVVRALAALVRSAIRVTPRDGGVTLRIAPESSAIRFSVHDGGAAVRTRAFDGPARAEDGPRLAPDLGLFVARAVAIAHGGDATAEAGPGGAGTVLVLYIPQLR